MLPGSRRGPKSKQWTKAVQETFVNFFAKRSEPLNPAEKVTAPLVEATGAGLSWLFSSFGEEPVQVRAAQGGPVRNVVLDITGDLAALGNGQESGVGSCQSYWVDHSDLEVLEATAGAVRRVRGGTGDLQLRIADGTFVWCTAHHCRPWRLEDGVPLAAASPPAPAVPTPAGPKPPPSPPPPPLCSASPDPAADTPVADVDAPLAVLSKPETVVPTGEQVRALPTGACPCLFDSEIF